MLYSYMSSSCTTYWYINYTVQPSGQVHARRQSSTLAPVICTYCIYYDYIIEPNICGIYAKYIVSIPAMTRLYALYIFSSSVYLYIYAHIDLNKRVPCTRRSFDYLHIFEYMAAARCSTQILHWIQPPAHHKFINVRRWARVNFTMPLCMGRHGAVRYFDF